jgi:hypothetical protein
VGGVLNYNDSTPANAPLAYYYMAGLGISNSPLTENLYLDTNSSPLTYQIFVQSTSSSTFLNSLVSMYRYNPNNNQLEPVGQVNVTSTQAGQVVLQSLTTYKFYAYTPSGYTLLAASPNFKATSCSSPPCSYIIYVGSFNTSTPSTFIAGLNQNCVATPNNALSTNTITCSWSVPSGTAYPFNLTIKQNNAFAATTTCTQSLNASTGTLTCTAGSTNTNYYTWVFSVKNPSDGSVYQLQNGAFGKQGINYGLDGVFFAILFILALCLLFVSQNINITIVMFDVGFVAMALLGFISFPIEGVVIPGLVGASCIVLYIANRAP